MEVGPQELGGIPSHEAEGELHRVSCLWEEEPLRNELLRIRIDHRVARHDPGDSLSANVSDACAAMISNVPHVGHQSGSFGYKVSIQLFVFRRFMWESGRGDDEPSEAFLDYCVDVRKSWAI